MSATSSRKKAVDPVALEKHRRYHREYAKRWRKRHPGRSKELSNKTREWQLKNPTVHAWSNYRTGAKKRELAFELTREQFGALIRGECYYCGQEPDPINGVDRTDSSKGYVASNVVSCCTRCNIAKRSFSVREFLAWAKRVAKRWEGGDE